MHTNSAPITTLFDLSDEEEPITLRQPDSYPDDLLPPTLRMPPSDPQGLSAPHSVREEVTDSDFLAE